MVSAKKSAESRAYSALSDPSFFGVAHWGTDAFYCGLEPEEGRGQRERSVVHVGEGGDA